MKSIKTNLNNLYQKLKSFIRFYTKKNLSAYSGTLSYFLFSGFIPFLALLIKIGGLFSLEKVQVKQFLNRIFPLEIAVESFFKLAEKREVAILLMLFGIYSATRFYFNLIGVGEKIFLKQKKGGKLKRIFSFLHLFAILFFIVIAITLEIAGKKILIALGVSGYFLNFIYYAISIFLNLLLSVVLHAFATPHKFKLKNFFSGVLLTFAVWQITGTAFN